MAKEKMTFRKNKEGDHVWIVKTGYIGENAVSFDKKKIFYLYEDYPQNFNKEQLEILIKEVPFLIEYLGR